MALRRIFGSRSSSPSNFEAGAGRELPQDPEDTLRRRAHTISTSVNNLSYAIFGTIPRADQLMQFAAKQEAETAVQPALAVESTPSQRPETSDEAKKLGIQQATERAYNATSVESPVTMSDFEKAA